MVRRWVDVRRDKRRERWMCKTEKKRVSKGEGGRQIRTLTYCSLMI